LKNGGAIATSNFESIYSIINSNFTNNKALYGGAVYIFKHNFYNVTISKSNFNNNQAQIDGGDIYIKELKNLLLI
jgi:hypothetical protein